MSKDPDIIGLHKITVPAPRSAIALHYAVHDTLPDIVLRFPSDLFTVCETLAQIFQNSLTAGPLGARLIKEALLQSTSCRLHATMGFWTYSSQLVPK